MGYKVHRYRHTRTRTILQGNPRRLLQAVLEANVLPEVILWDGVVAQRVSDEQAEAIIERRNFLNLYSRELWTEKEWNDRGFTLTLKTCINIHHKELNGMTKVIPVLLLQSSTIS